ncbi:TetR/AcrR family transcriptional regulator [Halobacillus sp. BBL2006]|uniref:TetR/AcrR family transcriptional regulator n=1 Tax=Halobacillus sp. BBL2006 TaxID=1543706 RepID=UPI00054308E0|nr:TetR/AcrR family transcriptional regulator [Halobacillus sp. BBL2006]KHE67114.1 TetR family transcriptional regulator [Halobacillus sp. BBL2006]
MDSKFLNLEQEKRDRILNAALAEFAQRGYKQASTNQIVKDAGISKGALFHYFKNKKDLYLSLYDHFIDLFLTQMQEQLDWTEKDIFIRNRKLASIKIELFHRYPEIFNFLNSVLTEDAREIQKALQVRRETFLSQNYKEMMADIDPSPFREGVDVDKAVDVITWSLEGFSYRQQAKVKGRKLDEIDLEEVLDELDDYIEVLKQSFYQ